MRNPAPREEPDDDRQQRIDALMKEHILITLADGLRVRVPDDLPFTMSMRGAITSSFRTIASCFDERPFEAVITKDMRRPGKLHSVKFIFNRNDDGPTQDEEDDAW